MTFRNAIAVIGLVALGYIAATTPWPPSAHALSNPIGELQGGDDAEAIACSPTTPTKIQPASYPQRARSITIRNSSATAVYIGGSNVDATGGLSVCSSGCHYTNVFSFNATQAHCLSASGTVNVYPTWGF